MERDMNSESGAKALNLILIVGAAVLLLAATLAPVSKQVAQEVAGAGAPETVVVTAHPNHA
jgi:hypothetical protein